MKAEELRIGNLIGYLEVDLNNGREIIVPYFCTINDISDIIRGNIGNRYSYISLTEKWLLKFGFEVYEFDNGQPNQYRFKSRLIVIRENEFYDYGSNVKIQNVHQLQNLYFALTGEELIYNK